GHTLFLAARYAEAIAAYEEGARRDPRKTPPDLPAGDGAVRGRRRGRCGARPVAGGEPRRGRRTGGSLARGLGDRARARDRPAAAAGAAGVRRAPRSRNRQIRVRFPPWVPPTPHHSVAASDRPWSVS